ncbi:erythropoietin receptor [Lissotriton helveticus]
MEDHMKSRGSPLPRGALIGLLCLWVGSSSRSRAEVPLPEAQNRELPPDDVFQRKAAILISQESEYIKCFTQKLEDLTCFWEDGTAGERLPYSFYYQEEGQDEKACILSTQQMAEKTMYYICSIPMADVPLFTNFSLKIKSGHEGSMLRQRSLSVEKLVLLDAPSNVSVQMNRKRQLVIRWRPPYFKNMPFIIVYEVNISNSDVQKVEDVLEKTELVLTNFKGHTTYTIGVRAKPNNISFDGYWSAWSEPVTVVTPSDLDPMTLVVASTVALSLVLIAAILFLSYHRFLKSKIWPQIPDPSNHFDGLFTTHKGNFQQWLGHSSSYQSWRPGIYNVEGLVASLEVLSELTPALPGFPLTLGHVRGSEDMPIFVPQMQRFLEEQDGELPMPAHLPPLSMDSYVILGDNLMPCRLATDSHVASLGGPISQALLERPESVCTICTESANSNKEPGEKREQDSGRSGSCSSGSPEASHEEQTSTSSFEYAVFDPTKLALSSQPRAGQTDLKYPYLLVSDSGVSTDYSSMNCSPGLYSNLYENGVSLGTFPHNQVLYSQC